MRRRQPETPTKQMLLRVPEDLHDAYKGVAYLTGQSMNELGVRALVAYLRTADELKDEAFVNAVTQAREQYKLVLDKLADL